MSATVRGPYKRGLRSRQKILDAAAEVFGRLGYAGGSLRQIADSVSVSPAALIQHFQTKENLLVCVLEEWTKESNAAAAATGHDEGLGFFRNLVELMRYHTAHRGFIELFITLAAEATNPAHPAHAFMVARYDQLIATAVEQLRLGRERGEIRPLTDAELTAEARGLYSLMDGLELQWLLDPTIDLVGTFEQLLDTTLARWSSDPADARLRGRAREADSGTAVDDEALTGHE